MITRKYVLQRVRSGDYLFASNDAQTLWRVYKHYEDGFPSAAGIKGWFWSCARRPMPDGDEFYRDVLEWGWPWEYRSGPFKTREEAIEAALRE